MERRFEKVTKTALEHYFAETGVRDATKVFYYGLQRRLCNGLGRYNIEDITIEELQYFFDHANREKLISRRTIGGWLKILEITFDYALRKGLTTQIPALNTIILPPMAEMPDPDDRFLDDDKLQKMFLALSDNLLYSTIAEALLLSGLRIGELLALNKEDLSSERCMIRVRHSLTRIVVNRDTICVRYAVGEPKTRGSKRNVFVSPLFFTVIDQWQSAIRKDGRMKKALEKGNQNYIFINKNGDLFNYHTLQENFRKYLARHDIRFKVTFHMLRHCYVSYMVSAENGITLEDISRQIGHKSIKTTYDIYYTQTKEMQHKLSAAGTDTFRRFASIKK